MKMSTKNGYISITGIPYAIKNALQQNKLLIIMGGIFIKLRNALSDLIEVMQ